MSTHFMGQFHFDSDEENQVTFEMPKIDQKNNFGFKESQSVVLKPDQTQADKFISNKISKNLFFNIDDIDFHQDDGPSSRNQVVQNRDYGEKRSPMRRKKGNATIKLQPLNTLQLRKTTQKIELTKAPSLVKAVSTPVQLSKEADKKEHVHSIRRQNLLNFEIITSSDEQEGQNQELQNAKGEKLNLHKTKLPAENSLFFNDSEISEDENGEKISTHNQSNKNNSPIFKPLTKKRSLKHNDTKGSSQKQSSNEEPNRTQNKKSEPEDKQNDIKMQSQPNPQLSKILPKESISNTNTERNYNLIKSNQNQQKTQFNNIKNLLVNTLMQNSVLNLKIKRVKSLLNFFSPEFRVEFSQDNYFLMNSKKTSSKPTSTFAFTGSQSNYEEFSSKYLGKMKSNISGSIYNIFADGYNPTDAKSSGIAPRQLLATIIYTTELFGTGRPKQFTVFVKKPEYKYYRDIKGVKIYEEETPLHELYNNFEQNKDKINVFHTRKPVYSQQTKEYVMNFCGKVRCSSIKNFILEDRQNENQKVLLFGKNSEDQYVLDIHSSLTPIVGIGIALTVFDTRMGSD